MEIKNCPVCGYGPLDESYSSMQELRWSHDICPCCGCEYGYDDHLAHYKEWVSKGSEWFKPDLKPTGWALENQVKNQIRPWPPVNDET